MFSSGDLDAELNALFCIALSKCLGVGVRDNEINTLKAFLDHVVDRVSTRPSDTENGDPWFEVVILPRHAEIQCHLSFRPFACRAVRLTDP